MANNKLRSLIVDSLRVFFEKTRNISASKKVGLDMYKSGMNFSLGLLKSVPEVVSVYSQTNFKDIIPGESDIDLFVIIQDMALEKELDFIPIFLKRLEKIKRLFPFMSISLQFETEFRHYQRLRHEEIFRKGKHFNFWKLVYGKQILRSFNHNEEKLSSFVIRDAYENILLNIYETIVGGRRFRRLYKYTLHLIRCLFMMAKKRDGSSEEYQLFLKKQGFDDNFINSFFSLSEQDFRADRETLCIFAFNIIKIIESYWKIKNKKETSRVIGELKPTLAIEQFVNSLNKQNVSSIYISKIPFKENSHNLYFVLNKIEYPEFRSFFFSFLDNLQKIPNFKKELFLRIKSRNYQDFTVFPLILTKELMNNELFINGFDPQESSSFNKSGKILFGKKIKMNVNNIIKSSNRLVNRDIKAILEEDNWKAEERLNQLMANRLLNERKIVCLNDVGREYSKKFKDIVLISERNKDKYLFARKLLLRRLNSI